VGVRVINGVTAGLSAAQQLGVSLTHRQHAHGVLFITGHAAVAKTTASTYAVDWPELARAAQRNRLTLVIYMGVQTALSLQQGLQEGLPMDTPVAVVQNASLPSSRIFHTSLGQLHALFANEKILSPAIIVVGDVLKGLNEWQTQLGTQPLDSQAKRA
jgi:uroporphyrin-III C-methyltransferase